MPARIAPFALVASLLAPGLALAMDTAVPSRAQPAAPTLQGQKPWDFLVASPSERPRRMTAPRVIDPRAREGIVRPGR